MTEQLAPPAPLPSTSDRVRRQFRVAGVVQGVGFRPFVYVTATSLGLAGEVSNDSSGVVVEVEGDPAALAEFATALRRDAPPLASVERVLAVDMPVQGGTGFTIADTRRVAGGRTLAGPDVATCADCLRELTDPADRRYRHPFISCTNCGPRFTVTTALPYDRGTTTMAGFPLCDACAREYTDPTDRRFHAQTIACHDCGPTLELVRKDAAALSGEDALRVTRSMLADGGIVAVKGIGGYHLVCDAADDAAVTELRRRKRRGDKAFAVMVADLHTAQSLVDISPAEAELLTSAARPVVLLRRAEAANLKVAPAVAPRKPHLGLMLPYSPLHTLLFGLPGDRAGPDVLVMTSGNLGGEPIAYRDEDARERLTPLVDAWLRHDRPIFVPCDDSVVRIVDDAELPLRRSRGFAPLPVALPAPVSPTLAVGADLKNTCCVADDGYAWLSQHIGDMDDLATLEAFGRTERHLEELTGVAPQRIACDAHPAYRSADWARTTAHDRPLRTVQHHHAHVAAVLGEHGHDGTEPVIGIAFDGTGFGTDRAIWGGEVLIADYARFRRFAHLAYVPLPGGDAAVDRPYRMALAHLRSAGVSWDADLAPVRACRPGELGVLRHQLESGFGCVSTSSMGRLFDAVAALAGVRQVADYEAEAAIELEGISAELAPGDTGYDFDIRAVGRTGGDSTGLRVSTGSTTAKRSPESPTGPDVGAAATGDEHGVVDVVADAAPLVRAVVADVRAGTSAAVIGSRFHAGVATLVCDLASRARDALDLNTVALGGGVFQNALLLSLTRRQLQDRGFTVLAPRRLPPNDGGIALGQLLVAASGH
jgi:hydrogenase maturation protein HypF